MNPLNPQEQQQQDILKAGQNELENLGQQISYPLDYASQSIINQVVKDYLTTASVGGINGYQIFTASGTFIVPAGKTKFLVKAVGGGQGGNASSTPLSAANSGNSGDLVESVVDLTAISTVTVTVGTGTTGGTIPSPNAAAAGDTTFGSYVTAKGGSSVTTSVGTFILPGFTSPVSSYSFAQSSTANRAMTGTQGGSNPFGIGGAQAVAAAGASTAGNNAQGYGAGGSGAVIGAAGSGAAGGNGTDGLVIVIW